MVFYILRNICFCSFQIIKGFNSIEYIRYPEWKIGHQNGKNSFIIYQFFHTYFWSNELGMSQTIITDTFQNRYPYSLSQKMVAKEIKKYYNYPYVKPRRCETDNSKEKKRCLAGFQELLDVKKNHQYKEEQYQRNLTDKEISLIWRITKFSGDSSHIIYGILIKLSSPGINIGYLLSERPMLARTTVLSSNMIQPYAIYVRDVKKITEIKQFLHQETAQLVITNNKFKPILNTLKKFIYIIKFLKDTVDDAQISKLEELYQLLEVYDDHDTTTAVTIPHDIAGPFIKDGVHNIVLLYNYILNMIRLVNAGSEIDLLTEETEHIDKCYEYIKTLTYFEEEGKKDINFNLDKIIRIIPKLTKLCSSQIPKRRASYVNIYFSDYYKTLKSDIIKNDLTQGLTHLSNINIIFSTDDTIRELFNDSESIYNKLSQALKLYEKTFQVIYNISNNICTYIEYYKRQQTITEISDDDLIILIEENLKKNQVDNSIINGLANNIELLTKYKNIYEHKLLTIFQQNENAVGGNLGLLRKIRFLEDINHSDKYKYPSINRQKYTKKGPHYKPHKTRKGILKKKIKKSGGTQGLRDDIFQDYRYSVIDTLNDYMLYLFLGDTSGEDIIIDGQMCGRLYNFENIDDIYRYDSSLELSEGIEEGQTLVNFVIQEYTETGEEIYPTQEKIFFEINSEIINNISISILILYDIFIDIILCAITFKQQNLSEGSIEYIKTIIELQFKDEYVKTLICAMADNIDITHQNQLIYNYKNNMYILCENIFLEENIKNDIIQEEFINEGSIFYYFFNDYWNTIFKDKGKGYANNIDNYFKNISSEIIKHLTTTEEEKEEYFTENFEKIKDDLQNVYELTDEPNIEKYKQIRSQIITTYPEVYTSAAAAGKKIKKNTKKRKRKRRKTKKIS